MKKLMTLMLGVAFAFGTLSVAFAQDAPAPAPQKEGKKKSGKKKSSKKKTEEPKSGN